MSYNAARERILRALKAKKHRDNPGRAWVQWDKWSVDQKRHFLRVWCHLSKPQINHFSKLPWYSLNLHVRKAARRFFRRTPVVDKVLGDMRYPISEKANVAQA